MSENLEFAVGLAKQAGEIMKRNFALGMKKEWKDNDTPLTVTDTEINALVMKAVEEKYPTHSFLGEEGSRIIESEYTWVCDPVDGTMPFSYGYPTFAFSLALTKNGESVLGVIYDPMCDRLLHAEKGTGAFLNGGKIRVSNESEFSRKSFVSINGEQGLAPVRAKLVELRCRLPKLYSCVYTGMLVATGEFAAEVFEFDSPWDAAALKIIVEEAGGKVTNLLGEEQRYDRPIKGFIAGNPVMHQKLVEMVGPFMNAK